MILAIHVIIALLSIGCATLGYLRPSNNNLRASYALIAMTFTSGFFLVWNEPAQMLHTCMSGIAYLTVVTAAVFLTRRKMAFVEAESSI